MRITVLHEIVQTFSPPRTAIEVLRLRPHDFEGQHVASWSVDVDIDCRIRDGRDAFGNETQTIDIDRPVERLVILARGEIDTFDTAGVLRGSGERFPTEVFLRDSDFTHADAALRQFALDAAKAAKTPLDKPHLLMSALHEAFAVTPGEDESLLTAAQAFEAKAGDSRAMAHVFVAAARSLGLPARFVSGYHLPEGKTWATTNAAHAWGEVFVEGLGWIGFDPTVSLCMYEGHVRVAYGLDALGAAPLRAPPIFGATSTTTINLKTATPIGQSQSQSQS